MTGWLLIFSLLLLGGVLSTIGDRLGSLVGKARLSVFKLRPKRTAVLITVLTGSLISAFSLGFMLLVDSDLRVGLFQIKKLRAKEKTLEKRVNDKEAQLKRFEQKLIALRSGNIVISNNQILASSIFNINKSNNPRKEIDKLIQQANSIAFRRLMPGKIKNSRVLYILQEDVLKLEDAIQDGGEWVVNIRSLGNVVLGENRVLGFFEVGRNRTLVKEGEVIAKAKINVNEIQRDSINRVIRLLLAATKTEIKRRGSLSSEFFGSLSKELKFESENLQEFANDLLIGNNSLVMEAVALRTIRTSDPVKVKLRLRGVLETKL